MFSELSRAPLSKVCAVIRIQSVIKEESFPAEALNSTYRPLNIFFTINFSTSDTTKLTTAPNAARRIVFVISPDCIVAKVERSVPPTVPAAVP